jgi:U3 small nucleolar RNA-associated protein 19
VTSAVSLCRVFCRLMANGSLLRKKSHDAAQSTILEWLKDRYKDYTKELSALIAHEDPAVQTTALTLYMRLVKEDGAHMKPAGDEYYFPQMLFGKLMRALLYSEHLDDAVKQEFTSKYLNAHDDIRYVFYTAVSALIAEAPTPTPVFTANVLAILLTLENVPTADATLLGSTYTTAPAPSAQKQPPIHAKPTHRKLLQETWLATLRLPLTKDQIKTILAVMSIRIVPCFTRPQLLMDFLVDAYDAGGSISLLALNGLFYLIQTKNLDYPNFYTKLYALLTRDVFHVRYRSRFFRLLDTFLESTHLPAAMVASFIKRMARLALSAPPAAVVIVVPFVYNLLKRHPSCTFMVHREGSAEEREEWRKEGLTDVFEEREEDPMKTRAIESSLWEIEMLMAHWHPNVGTLARIIGEQFTKEKYILEDFLDHSYASVSFRFSLSLGLGGE